MLTPIVAVADIGKWNGLLHTNYTVYTRTVELDAIC